MSQTQGVKDDRERTEGHCSGGDHRNLRRISAVVSSYGPLSARRKRVTLVKGAQVRGRQSPLTERGYALGQRPDRRTSAP